MEFTSTAFTGQLNSQCRDSLKGIICSQRHKHVANERLINISNVGKDLGIEHIVSVKTLVACAQSSCAIRTVNMLEFAQTRLYARPKRIISLRVNDYFGMYQFMNSLAGGGELV